MPITKNQKNTLSKFGFYFVCAIILAFEIGVGFLFVAPKFKEVLEKNTNQIQISQEVASLASVIKAVSGIDKNKLQVYYNRSVAAIPNDKKTTGIVSGISKVAQDYGVVVKDLSFSPGLISSQSAKLAENDLAPALISTDNPNSPNYISASLSLVSTLDSLANFLKGLREKSQILGVTGFSYDVRNALGTTVETAVLIYYLPLNEDVAHWKNVLPLTEEEIKILEALPDKDSFILGQEIR